MGRPATGQTPGHSVRVPDHIWMPAAARVGERKMSELIVTLLDRENQAAERRAAREDRPAEPAPPVVAAPATTPGPGEPSPLAGLVAAALPRREPGTLPGHAERIVLIPDRVPEPVRLEYRRAARDEHAATQLKFAPPEPLSPEDLSLRMYEMAVADGYFT